MLPNALQFNADLLRLREELAEFYSGSEIDAWINARHRLLGDARPIDLLGTERANEVFAVLDQLGSGAYNLKRSIR